MIPAQLLAFYHDVLKLKDAQILELKTKGHEYPQDFSSYDSDSVEAIIKSLRSKDLALDDLSQMQVKQFCDFMQYLEVCGRMYKSGMFETLKHHSDSFSAIQG